MAKFFEVSKQTIYNWSSSKPGFPRGVNVGGGLKYERQDVEAWYDATFAATRKENAARLEQLIKAPTKKKGR